MDIYEAAVDHLFRQLPGPRGSICQWPVIGGNFVKGEDDETRMRQVASNALRARDWFVTHGPRDAPPLPLSDRDQIRFLGGISSIVGYYDQSLLCLDYEFEKHPSFHDYACGVMALNPSWADEELKRRFPPRPLHGLSARNFVWENPDHKRSRLH